MQGLALLPLGARAHVYADIALAAILAALESERGLSVRAPLAGVVAHSVTRNALAHQSAMHDLARRAEQRARSGARDLPSLAAEALVGSATRLLACSPPQAPRDGIRSLPQLGRQGQLHEITLIGTSLGTTVRERAGRLLVTLTYLEDGRTCAVKAVSRDGERGARKALRCLLRRVMAQQVTVSVPTELWTVAQAASQEFPGVALIPLSTVARGA